MKKFDCIMSGKLDNPFSSVESYFSHDNDQTDQRVTSKMFELHNVNGNKTSLTKV